MPKTVDAGLSYTYLDVNIFQDRKIKRLKRHVDDSAPLVYLALLCTIFKEGYYVRMDEDLTLDLSETTGFDEGYIEKVIDTCFEVGLLSKEMKEEHGILTSLGIQKQYQKVCDKSRKKSKVDEFSLLNNDTLKANNEKDIPSNAQLDEINVTFNANNDTLKANNDTFIRQSKVKESKEKKKKINSSSLSSSFASEEEKQQQEDFFLEEMFFKNWHEPNIEFQKFLDFNNTGGRVWGKMSPTERQSAFNLWKQKPEQAKHLPDAFLGVWKEFVVKLRENNAPRPVWLAAIDDRLNCELRQDALVLWCWPELRDYIEDPDNLEALLPSLRKMLSALKKPQLKYHILQEEHAI